MTQTASSYHPGTVVCTGAAVVDLIIDTPPALPTPGTSQLVEEIDLAAGGCGVNTAIGLARLGVDVRFWARLGADGAGDFLHARLVDAGVGVEHCRREAGLRTKAAVVLIDRQGERSFLRTRGGGNAIGPEDAAAFDWKTVNHLHIGGCYSLRRLLGADLTDALKLAKVAGVTTSVDTVWSTDNSWAQLLPALSEIDHLLPSLEEARALSGLEHPQEIIAWFHERGSGCIVLKLGAAGSLVGTRGQGLIAVPAFPIPGGRIVDTTGAGDAFCAGYIAAVQQGHPPREAARWGNAWAAVALSGRGATAALHDRSQLQAVLTQGNPLTP